MRGDFEEWLYLLIWLFQIRGGQILPRAVFTAFT
jgi:hypothetical protein